MKTNQGIIQLIIIIILSVVVLSLLGVSLRALFTDQNLKENFIFLWEFLKHMWGTYISPYAETAWSRVREMRSNQ